MNEAPLAKKSFKTIGFLLANVVNSGENLGIHCEICMEIFCPRAKFPIKWIPIRMTANIH